MIFAFSSYCLHFVMYQGNLNKLVQHFLICPQDKLISFLKAFNFYLNYDHWMPNLYMSPVVLLIYDEDKSLHKKSS